ncbi:MAG: Leucine efflux protein [Gammaproteobacteria bacterium]|nr:Leucine efflux protein [Gammaproteobacteria bacterium]
MEIAWFLFLAASIALIATPGQDLILVMSRAVTQGQSAGVITALGISVGLVVHTVLATLGLGVILKTSEWLFVLVKIIGAAYLVYLGLYSLLTARNKLALFDGEPRSPRRLFMDGAVSNVANPKIAIFYLAFLPQFVSAGAAKPTASLFILGLSFAVLTFVIKGPLALCAGRLSLWFRRRPAVLSWLYRTSGVVLVGLGVKLALERRA